MLTPLPLHCCIRKPLHKLLRWAAPDRVIERGKSGKSEHLTIGGIFRESGAFWGISRVIAKLYGFVERSRGANGGRVSDCQSENFSKMCRILSYFVAFALLL